MILILGMHRSGTSAMTGLIASMGAYAGEPADLLPATPDNPRGFFERNDVLAVNRTIMQHHHSNWYQVGHFDAPAADLPAFVHQKMAAIAKTLAPHAPWVIKDPRFCLTLPYWRPYLTPKVMVLAIRHPAAIAHSLQLRNGLAPEYGLALWEHYMVHALNKSAELPIIRCQYEALLANPSQEASALHAALLTYFPTLKQPDTSLLDNKLNRASNQSIALTPEQARLYGITGGKQPATMPLAISSLAREMLKKVDN